MECESSQRGNAAAQFHDWPDEVLLAKYVCTHDERLFNEIYERHEQMIWSECWRVLHHQRQDAETAAQNTWVVFLQKAATIRKGESLKHWLRSAAVGEALNLRKKNGRRNRHEQLSSDLAQVAQVAQPIDKVAFREEQALIDAELQCLPAKLRECLILHSLEGRRMREIAQELGLKEGTVVNQVRKARKQLRKRLKHLE